MPQVIVLLGQPAAESFERICGEQRSFKDLLSTQGERVVFNNLHVKRYVVPHPTAPYPGRSRLYEEVTAAVRVTLEKAQPSHKRGRSASSAPVMTTLGKNDDDT